MSAISFTRMLDVLLEIMRANMHSEFYQAAKSEQTDAERGRTDDFVNREVLTRVYIARIVRPQ
jgi:hypothetical protein